MRSSSRSGRCPPARPSVQRSRPRCARTSRRFSARWATTRSAWPRCAWRSPRTSAASGVPTDPDQVLVTNGAQQAVHLVGVAARRTGQLGRRREPDLHRRDRRVPDDRQSPDADARSTATAPRVEVVGLLAAGRADPPRLRRPDVPEPDRRDMPEDRTARAGAVGGRVRFPHRRGPDTRPEPRRSTSRRRIAAFDPGDRVITRRLAQQARLGRPPHRLDPGAARRRRPPGGRQDRRRPCDQPDDPGDRRARPRADRRGRRLHARGRGGCAATIITEALAERLPGLDWVAPEGGLSLWVRLPDADAVASSAGSRPGTV